MKEYAFFQFSAASLGTTYILKKLKAIKIVQHFPSLSHPVYFPRSLY